MKVSFAGRTLLLLSTALAAPAHSQTARTTALPDQASPDIVVTGARLQSVKDIAAKRSIDVISDSISSDEIGTLPDFDWARR